MLDISNSNDTVNIQIQCLSKSQAQYIASDLSEYEQYSMINTLSDILGDISLEEAEVQMRISLKKDGLRHSHLMTAAIPLWAQ